MKGIKSRNVLINRHKLIALLQKSMILSRHSRKCSAEIVVHVRYLVIRTYVIYCHYNIMMWYILIAKYLTFLD